MQRQLLIKLIQLLQNTSTVTIKVRLLIIQIQSRSTLMIPMHTSIVVLLNKIWVISKLLATSGENQQGFEEPMLLNGLRSGADI